MPDVEKTQGLNEDMESVEILIVDDDATSLMLLHSAVSVLPGVTTVPAHSGKEAQKLLQEREFALILMDVSMPDMSGFDVAKWLQEQDRKHYTPILFITAIHKDDQSVTTGYDLGVADYLFKPFDIKILQSKVRVFIELHRQRRELEENRVLLQAQKREITQSRERLLALFNHMPNGVAVYQPIDDGKDFILRNMNHAGEIMSRIRIDEERGKLLTEVFPGVREMGLLAVFRNVWKTGLPEYLHEMRFVTSSGEEIWFENSVYKLPFGELVAVYKDITEQKMAKATLLKGEERLRKTLDVVNEGVWDWRVDTGEVYFSPRYYTMLGYEVDEFPANYESFAKLVHPDDMEKVELEISESLKKGKKADLEMRLLAKNGEWRWIRTRGQAVEFDEDGNALRLLGSHADITLEKLDREELRKQERSLALAQRIANVGSWEREVNSTLGYWSDHTYRLFGYEPGEIDPSMEFLKERIVPEDWEQINIALGAAIRGEDSFEVDYRIIKKDGEIRYIQSRGIVEYNPEVNGPVMHGILYDVTEKIQAEKALRKSEDKYRSLYKSIRDAILVANTDREIIDLNPAFTDLFGYTLDDLIGMPTATVYESEKEFVRVGELARSIRHSSESYFYTVHYRKKSGEVFPGETNIFTLTNSQGETVGFVGMIRDVSERLKAEEALRESEERWRNLLQAISAGVVVYDSEMRIVAHNPAARSLMGIVPVLMDDREAMDSKWHFIRQDGSILPEDDYPVQMVTRTGKPLTNYIIGILNPEKDSTTWVLVNAHPIFSDTNELMEVIVTFMDIGENIRKEEELKQRTYELEVLHEISSRLGYTLDYNDVLRLLIENLSQVFEFDVAAGLVFHEQTSQVFTQCSAEISPKLRKEIIERMFEAANDFAGSCELNGAEGTQELVCTLPVDGGEVVGAVESSFVVPMFERHGDVAGVLYVGARKANAFNADQVGLVFKVAEQVGRSMRMLRTLVDENIEEVSQVLTAMPSGIVLLDESFTIIMANPRGEEKLKLLAGKGIGEQVEELGGIPIQTVMDRALNYEELFQIEYTGSPWRVFHVQGREIKTGPQAGYYVLSLHDVTKEREASERIRASEERFRTLFDNASDAIFVIGPDGRIIDVNGVACDRLEYSREELLSMTPSGFDVIESEEGLKDRIQAVMNKGFIHFETEHRRKSGSIVPTEINAKRIYYEGEKVVLATARNITERKQAEADRAEHEAILNAILTGIQASFIIFDSETMEVVESNLQASVLLGHTNEEMVGMSCSELLNWPICSDLTSDKASRGGAVFLGQEATLTRDDGSVIPVAVSRLNLVRGGQSFVIVILFDISERKSLERQLAYAQKLESVGQLAAGIAHEINTPIQYVASNVSFLQKAFEKLKELIEHYNELHAAVKAEASVAPLLDELEQALASSNPQMLLEEIPEAIADSHDGVDRVAKIVQAMKKFSHPDVEEMKQIDVNDAIKNTITVARNEWKYDSDLSLELAEGLPLIEGLPGDFNQAILNVLVNAAHANSEKAAKEGGKGTIFVSTHLDEPCVEVRIQDSGVGIPVDNYDRVFDPFFTTKEVGKGTGQGLAITHSILDKHGGTISFESIQGKGTTFILRFPIQQVKQTRCEQ